jgi:glutathione S-transferase
VSRPILFVGNKNYSSWSLRPWLALRWARIDFEERVIPLGGDGYGASAIPEVVAVSPTGRVPVLHVGDLRIPDSLAICEWAAEARPDAALWPKDAGTRALCRAAACEMHSGFGALRRDLGMNIRRRTTQRPWPADTKADLARLTALWRDALAASGGPWLFGARTIADAFFTPVATRFRTYGVELEAPLARYAATLLDDVDFRAWEQAAITEPWTIGTADAL